MPKMPNPFDKPKGKRAAKGKGYAFKPIGDFGQGPYPSKRAAMPSIRKRPKAGVDTRPTEREPKRVAPRQRMPKELASMPPKRGVRMMPKPMPKKPKRKP